LRRPSVVAGVQRGRRRHHRGSGAARRADRSGGRAAGRRDGRPVRPGTGEDTGVTVREAVPAALDGERVDRVVSMLTGLTRADAADVVSGGGVAIDGVVVTTRSRRVK